MWESSDLSVEKTLHSIAPSIVTMLKEGWFDDAVGLVEGFDVFRQLMKHGILLQTLSKLSLALTCRAQTR